MRIITGKFKGRKLKSLGGDRVRPTSDRVKESLFSILRPQISDANFLDLCAGSGNIGIEAVSQGASKATFVDKSSKSIAIIKQNLAKCNLSPKSPKITVIRSSAKQAITILAKQGEVFDFIYFDPPYDSDIYVETLQEIDDKEVLTNEGLIIAEHSQNRELPELVGELYLEDIRKYGKTKLSFYSPIVSKNFESDLTKCSR